MKTAAVKKLQPSTVSIPKSYKSNLNSLPVKEAVRNNNKPD